MTSPTKNTDEILLEAVADWWDENRPMHEHWRFADHDGQGEILVAYVASLELPESDYPVLAQEVREACISLLITDASGIYIPQRFAEELSTECYDQQSPEVQKCLDAVQLGPDYESYWDDWTYVTDNYQYVSNDISYGLHQDGDLWSVNKTELDKYYDEILEHIWL